MPEGIEGGNLASSTNLCGGFCLGATRSITSRGMRAMSGPNRLEGVGGCDDRDETGVAASRGASKPSGAQTGETGYPASELTYALWEEVGKTLATAGHYASSDACEQGLDGWDLE